jgi:hypothetical protein
MKTLTVLDFLANAVVFIQIPEKMVEKLENECNGDVESFIRECEIDKICAFDASNACWMLSDEYPEVFLADAETKEVVDGFLTM